MLERLISAALQRRWAVLGGMLVLTIAGVLALRALTVDAFPDTTPVQVQINAYATSLVLITAGFFFGRTSVSSARPAA